MKHRQIPTRRMRRTRDGQHLPFRFPGAGRFFYSPVQGRNICLQRGERLRVSNRAMASNQRVGLQIPHGGQDAKQLPRAAVGQERRRAGKQQIAFLGDPPTRQVQNSLTVRVAPGLGPDLHLLAGNRKTRCSEKVTVG